MLLEYGGPFAYKCFRYRGSRAVLMAKKLKSTCTPSTTPLGLPNAVFSIELFVLFLVLFGICNNLATATPILDEITFMKAKWCNGQALTSICHYHSQPARSSLECTIRCDSHHECMSADYDVTNKLCHLSRATAKSDCSNMETAPTFKHYEKPNNCLNGGSVDTNGNCSCPDPYCGPLCQQVMQECQDVYNCGTYTYADARRIWPLNSPAPFQVQCQVAGSAARTYIMRNNVTGNFNRSWADYKNGFGEVSEAIGDHWLGLEKFHLLTNNRAYNLRFMLTMKNLTQYFGTYPNFALNNESNGYTFTMSSPPNVLMNDCLTPVKGARFSTYDNDNDNATSVNCAMRHGGGFWFSGANCSSVCNPFGNLLWPATDARTGVSQEAFWNFRDGSQVTPRNVLAFLLNR